MSSRAKTAIAAGLGSASLALLFSATAALVPLMAQSPEVFEAISIKPNLSGADSSDTNTNPGRIDWINVAAISLVQRAFGVPVAQIVGAPRWLSTERFDIIATTATSVPLNDLQRKSYVQSMLADRFRFKFHRETRELRSYSLVIAKGGPKFAANTGKGQYAMKVDTAIDRIVLPAQRAR